MILVLRALGVGDLATGVPALRGLRRAFPAEELALAAPAWLTPLIDLIGGVDRVVPTDGLAGPERVVPTDGLAGPERVVPAAGLAAPGRVVPTGGPAAPAWDVPPPAIAVNLHGRGPQSHRLLAAARPAKLWAFASAAAGFRAGPEWVEEEHEVRRWCRMLRHYGVPVDEADLSLAVPGVDVPRGVTIIHPGAKSPSRRWPPERYAAVARSLAAAGHRVLVTGSAAEEPLTARVAAAAGVRPAPPTTLAELAALIANARLLISGDTGVSHLATAYGTPSVTLFGPMSPARWGPPLRPYHRVLWHGTRSEPGDRPDPGVHPALLAVTVAEVLEACDSGPILSASGGRVEASLHEREQSR